MRQGPILSIINEKLKDGKKGYWVLLDPDDFSPEEAANIASLAGIAGADAIVVGGSLLHTDHLDEFIASIKAWLTTLALPSSKASTAIFSFNS
jgi:phosphoglycerol geranylgeranyltransferase